MYHDHTNRKLLDQLIKMNIVLFACVLLSFTVSVESIEELCPWRNSPTSEQKMQTFNSTKSICCDHGVQPKYDKRRQELKCCANTTYYAQVDICCKGKVFPRMSNEGFIQKCCGSRVYDESEGEQICCKGNLFPNPGGSKSCCGPSLIDSSKMCCSDESMNQYTTVASTPYTDCCLAQPYDTRTEHCYLKTRVLPINTEICGNQQFSLESDICCSNQTLYPLTAAVTNGDKECCGAALVNLNTHRCCRTSTLPHIEPKERTCCGNGHFDRNKQRCCKDKVLDANPEEECCGSTLYNTQTQGCCGGVPYDKSTSQCCRGEIGAHK